MARPVPTLVACPVNGRAGRRVAAPTLLLVALLAAGCFPARTLEPDRLRTAYPTEFRLRAPTTVTVQPAVGDRRTVEGVSRVYGVLTALAGDTAVVTAATLTIDGRERELRADEAVTVPVSGAVLATAQQRRFSGTRTLALVGGVVGGTLLALAILIAAAAGASSY